MSQPPVLPALLSVRLSVFPCYRLTPFPLCCSFYSSLFSWLSKQDQTVKRRPYSQRNAAYPAYDGHMSVIVRVFCASEETDSPREQKVKDL